MGPFSFRKALVILCCFVLCTLSLLAFYSSYGSPFGHVNLLSGAKLALSKYGLDHFRDLAGIQSNAPILDVRREDHALVDSSQDAQLINRWRSGKLSETGSHPEASSLAFNGNTSSSLSLMHNGTDTVPVVGSAAKETLTNNRSVKRAPLTHFPSGDSKAHLSPRFLYWGPEIDHPNAVCSGFNHQTVSLVCALNEALATNRTFILPSHMCISRRHRGLPQLGDEIEVQDGGRSSATEATSSHSWAELESLIDVGCLNTLVPVVLNKSAEVRGFLHRWEAQSATDVGRCFNLSGSELRPTRNKEKVSPIEGVLQELQVPSESEAPNKIVFPDENKGGGSKISDKKRHSSGSVCVIDGGVSFADVAPWNVSELLVRTRPSGVHFPWFKVCKQGSYEKRIWHSQLFPVCFAEPLRKAAREMQAAMGDYDAVHVRRGDKLTGYPSRHWPHLARDTSPSAIRARLSKWIPAGRSVYVASNEANQSFFEELRRDFKVFQPFNFSAILRPVIRNEYQLYIVENLVLRGATTFVATFREEDMLGHNTSHFLT
ncbi:hypothetical protein KFL_000210020 [Klebsormidium nitens]|uniref:Uncharacterized protein n=1 Tax=Klebsormidium nitens TaxID=105231 RepID=A0A1Y1HQP8_KLENI|nr:hypothetical protein KFL_000210020 [Klebsormidium nitens]|eukprot:GAQ78916.1 hypothetical protein KFL_000210020 [Klebsormidium nitens]